MVGRGGGEGWGGSTMALNVLLYTYCMNISANMYNLIPIQDWHVAFGDTLGVGVITITINITIYIMLNMDGK